MKKRIFLVLVLMGVLFNIPMIGNKLGMMKVAEATVSYALEYDSLPVGIKSNCVAFARYKVPSLPYGLETMQDKKNIINSYTPKVGAIAITTGNSAYGHVAYVEAVNGDQITTLNGGWEDKSHIGRYTATAAAQGIVGYWYSGTVSDPPSGNNVSFSDFNQNGIWETNAEMYIKIMNPDKASVSKVGCYLYNASGTLLKSYSEDVSYTTSYVNYNCNINNDMKYTLSEGTTYKFVLYAVVNGKEYKDITRTFTTKGTTVSVPAPSISDIQVSEFDGNGYMVKCKVSDSSGITRVQFPTWTEVNGQDDIVEDWSTNTVASGTLGPDGYYSYFVSVADHNFESGLYHTHIYAYNSSGMSSSAKATDVDIPLYCFKALDTKTGEDTVSSRDVCIVEGRILLPKETSFSDISIVTSAEAGGRTITITKDYGGKTIPAGTACFFEQLVDRKDFDNADGVYTTVWNFETADGTVTKQTMAYDMSINPGTIYTKANTGDLCNLYGVSGLPADEWLYETNTFYQNNIYDHITKPSDKGEVACLKQGRIYIIWKNRETDDRKMQVLDIQAKTGASSQNHVENQNTSGNPVSTVKPDREVPSKSQTAGNKTEYRKSDANKNKTSVAATKIKLQKVSKVKYKKKKKMILLSWKKVSKASGYQIQIAKNKSFTKKRKKSDASITSGLIFVKAKGKYYIRVRAYAYQNGKKVYGKWSKTKKIKV